MGWHTSCLKHPVSAPFGWKVSIILQGSQGRDESKTMNRILVVDDEPSILQGLALGLSSQEISVDLANAGKAAIRKGSQQEYDVLIVDLCLPDMHGFDVIRKLKEQNPQLIVIVITAQCSKESVAEARGLGVHDYFEKPFHIHSIKEAIARGIVQRTKANI